MRGKEQELKPIFSPKAHMEAEGITIQDLTAILKRRKWALILPALIIFAIAAAVAFGLPSIYRSTATILIEEQEVPREFVMSMVTSYAEQRIESITQRIMSSRRLIGIINRFNLYPDLRKKQTIEESVTKMREDIKIETISADVRDRRTGRAKAATIAFAVSYEGEDPNIVLQVANVLTSLYLEENLKMREEKTAETAKFIEDELKNVQKSLAQQDAKISDYKKKHFNSLPEMNQMNIQELERLERNKEQLQIQLRTLRERESFIKTQMANTPHVDPDKERLKDRVKELGIRDPEKQRLEQLRLKLNSLKTQYSDDYPDVIKTKDEIAELEKKMNVSSHEPITSKPDNPVYINLDLQLSSIQSEIDSMVKQIRAIENRQMEYRRRTQAAPGVEKDYKILIAERNNLQVKYDDLMKKHMETKIASGMEKEQLGERFTLIDPARMPEKPVKPNRLAILFIGLFLGMGGGVGAASLREVLDQTVRSGEALTRATGFPVLASIPEILTHQDVIRKQTRKRIWLLSTIVLVALGVVLVHFFIMDLDVFLAKLSRKIPI